MQQREDYRDDSGAVRPAAGRGARLGALLSLALVCAVVAAFGAVALLRQPHAPSGAPQMATPTSTATALSATDWMVYRDPLGLFTMRLPPGWTSHVYMGTYSFRSPQGSYSGQTENIALSDPTLGGASASLQIDTEQLTNPTLAQLDYCGASMHETSSFNGYPANTTLPAVILFESGDAHFQVDETIPGVLEAPHTTPLELTPPPTPTPLPATAAAADRALLATALATFQPTDPKPLACP